MEQEPTEVEAKSARWTLVRDVLVFQCKLVVDGLRDLVLVPVSLIVAIVGLVGKGPSPGSEFYDLLRLARRSERWINLFGAVEKREAGPTDTADATPTPPDLDALVSRVETFLVDEYRKGGVTAQAKARMEGALDSLHSVRKRIGRRQA
jgi:hypothetical protein